MGGVVQDRVDTETISDEKVDEDVAIVLKKGKQPGKDARAQSSSFAKRPLIATDTGDQMLHTMSTGMYGIDKVGGGDLVANEPAIVNAN